MLVNLNEFVKFGSGEILLKTRGFTLASGLNGSDKPQDMNGKPI